jgi:hypothetical protein
MAKRLVAKVGTYQKDGEEKGEYVKIGVILSNENGEFAIIDPTVNLAGVAYKQRVNGISKQDSDSVMVGIFSDDRQGQQQQSAPPTNNGGFDDNLPPF